MSTCKISRRQFVKQSAMISGLAGLGMTGDFLGYRETLQKREALSEENLKQLHNIVIFCPNEMRADKTGTFEHPLVKTPKMDRLAQNGVVFENHFSCHSKCVPSQISFMTGAYPHAEGFRADQVFMSASRHNLASTLKQLGYKTALVGKNHCFDEDEIDAFLTERLVLDWDKYPK